MPRQFFTKGKTLRNGGQLCRQCAKHAVCAGCNQYLPSGDLDAQGCCRRCTENEQIDRFLQTPKDEVSHFGMLEARKAQTEADYAVLLVCQRLGLHERMVAQRILEFSRLPHMLTQKGMHHCELCDETFSEVAPLKKVRMAMPVTECVEADWAECPGERLHFFAGQSCKVLELRRTEGGIWFFRTQGRRRRPEQPERQRPEDLVLVSESCWGPLSATEEARRTSALVAHLRSERHRKLEDSVSSGRLRLVKHAAATLAKQLGERPTTSLSRFQEGLGITERFCSPVDVDRAAQLERVRDLDIPIKFMRLVLPGRQDQQLLWITREELLQVEEEYEKRGKRGARR